MINRAPLLVFPLFLSDSFRILIVNYNNFFQYFLFCLFLLSGVDEMRSRNNSRRQINEIFNQLKNNNCFCRLSKRNVPSI